VTKYDRMVATNRATSEAKIAKAKAEIAKMVSENIQVTVGELVKRTGLSRGFFYKNEEVCRALENARDLQNGKALTRPQKVILDAAMDKQLQILQQQIEKLKSENSSLSKKNQDLQKALNKKDLNFIKNL
jgi:regulator of replication initiation timing